MTMTVAEAIENIQMIKCGCGYKFDTESAKDDLRETGKGYAQCPMCNNICCFDANRGRPA